MRNLPSRSPHDVKLHGALRRDDFSQRVFVVSGAAGDRAADFAVVRRRGVGMGRVSGVFSERAARGLRLRRLDLAQARPAYACEGAYRAAGSKPAAVADYSRRALEARCGRGRRHITHAGDSGFARRDHRPDRLDAHHRRRGRRRDLRRRAIRFDWFDGCAAARRRGRCRSTATTATSPTICSM